jgi:hypothetical protein
MESGGQALAGGAGHVASKTLAVGSQSDGSSHTQITFISTVQVLFTCAFTITRQPEGELLRVHEKCS